MMFSAFFLVPASAELGKINVGEQLGLHMINGSVESFLEFVKIFFVDENLVLNHRLLASIVKLLRPLGDGHVIIVVAGRFYVKKVYSLTSEYLL